MKKYTTRFSFKLWRHTAGDESLFDLTPEELFIFNALVTEACK